MLTLIHSRGLTLIEGRVYMSRDRRAFRMKSTDSVLDQCINPVKTASHKSCRKLSNFQAMKLVKIIQNHPILVGTIYIIPIDSHQIRTPEDLLSPRYHNDGKIEYYQKSGHEFRGSTL